MTTTDTNRAAGYLARELATGLAADKDVTVTESQIPDVAASLKPQLLHLTNNEPWYQSRVTWGVIISVISALAAMFGFTIEAEMQSTLLNSIMAIAPALGVIVGSVVTLYGRWVARKPLGT